MSALHEPVLAVVRRARPRAAVARPGRLRVVGDGLGVHAPADAGGPGAAGARAVAGALADARPTWPPSRPARRCAPGAGSATRAGRCGCTRPPSRSSSGTAARCRRRTTTCGRCPASATTRRRRSRRSRYGRRHVVLDTNVRRVFARGDRGRGVPVGVGHEGRARGRARAAARGRADRGDLVGRGDGARRAGVHRREPALRRLPGRRPVRLARGRPPGVRRAAAQGADLGRHRPAVPRPAARRAPRQRRPGAPQPAGRGVVGRGPAGPLPGRPWSRTAWSSHAGPDTYALP